MKTFLIILFLLISVSVSAEIFYVHIIGNTRACPGTVHKYYLETDQSKGDPVIWTITNGEIKNPKTGQWAQVLSYTTSDVNFPIHFDYQHDVRFFPGNSGKINVSVTNVFLTLGSEKTVITNPPAPQAILSGDPKLMNYGSYSNRYTVIGLSDGWVKGSSWSIGSGLTSVGSSGNYIDLKPSSSNFLGTSTLSTPIQWKDDNNNTCGTTPVLTRNITVISPNLTVTGPSAVCPGGLYQYYAKFEGAIEQISGALYNWTYPAGYLSLNGNNNYSLNLQVPQYNTPGGAVRVTATLSCGTFINGITVYPYCYGSYTYSVSPNPVDDELTVELVPDYENYDVFNSYEDNLIQTVLYDEKGEILIMKTLKNMKDVLNFNNLKPDTYFLKVFINKEQIGPTRRIVKK